MTERSIEDRMGEALLRESFGRDDVEWATMQAARRGRIINRAASVLARMKTCGLKVVVSEEGDKGDE